MEVGHDFSIKIIVLILQTWSCWGKIKNQAPDFVKGKETHFILKFLSWRDCFLYIRRDHQFQWYPSTYLLHCLRKLLNHLQEEQDKFNLKKNCLFVKCYIFTLREFSRWSSINLSGKKRWKSYFIINFIVISEFTHYLSLEKQRYNVCAEEWFFFEN